jgi:5-methylcytosine-specific restriction endonuclease McrA
MTDKEILECTHEDGNSMEFVKRKNSNGIFMLNKQCYLCGFLETKQLPHYRVDKMSDVNTVDDELIYRREKLEDEEWEKEREKKRLEYEESKPERQKEWERLQKEDAIKYEEYLKSPEWREKRDFIFRRDNGICVLCNGVGKDVHHISYKRKYNEDHRDLILLCKACHAFVHDRVIPSEIAEIDEEKVYF